LRASGLARGDRVAALAPNGPKAFVTLKQGDAIKAYPNLAATPLQAWKQAIYNRKILAVPIPGPRAFNRVYYSTTTYESVIGKDVATNADEFKRILQQLTSPKDGRYGYIVNVGYSPIFTDVRCTEWLAPRWRQARQCVRD
jgi:hypothetical protein